MCLSNVMIIISDCEPSVHDPITYWTVLYGIAYRLMFSATAVILTSVMQGIFGASLSCAVCLANFEGVQ